MSSRYSLSHLADSTLIRQMASLAAQDCITTAELLARIMEFDAARRLSLDVRLLRGVSEDATAKRIHAGRAARRFPVLFELLASGAQHAVPHVGALVSGARAGIRG